ncbi:hypothetical protein TNCV_1955381 [Trichonephila clavipes]|nr:hypothetical protein TNCV_1955381 [Trichonephila clavipes]
MRLTPKSANLTTEILNAHIMARSQLTIQINCLFRVSFFRLIITGRSSPVVVSRIRSLRCECERILPPLNTLHVEGLMHVKSVKTVKFMLAWNGNVENAVPAQVLSSLDRGSKLRRPSPIAFMLPHSTA